MSIQEPQGIIEKTGKQLWESQVKHADFVREMTDLENGDLENRNGSGNV